MPGNATLPIGGFKSAIQENGDPRDDSEKKEWANTKTKGRSRSLTLRASRARLRMTRKEKANGNGAAAGA